MRVAFLGDTLLGGDAQPVLERLGYDYPFRHLSPLLSQADLVVINHEGPLTTVEEPYPKADTGRSRFWYRARPEAVSALVAAGVGVASLANNHVLDFGLTGLDETRRTLDSAGIRHCGAGINERAAREPAVVDVRGTRIAFLSYMERGDLYQRDGLYASGARGGCAMLRRSAVTEDINAARELADLCIVLAHWGRNYRPESPRQERLARLLQEAGADLVIGHHPHIPQRVGLGRPPILFSIGNGAFGTVGGFHRGHAPYGLVVFVDFEADRPVGIELRLLLVDNAVVDFCPRPVEGPEAIAWLRTLVHPDPTWNERDEAALYARLDQDS